jgi:hypothetical protein
VNPVKYAAGLGEVSTYQTTAKRGCWAAGSSSLLTSKLKPDEVLFDGKIWNINYVPDAKSDKSGLLFYTKSVLVEKPEPKTVPVPAPSLSKKQEDDLAKEMDQIKVQGAKAGWSALEIIGMIVLIGLAIAAIIYAAAIIAAITAAIAAIIATISALLAAVSAGTVALLAGLAALFAFSTPSLAADAEQKGQEKQSGLLDSAIDWFKSWF